MYSNTHIKVAIPLIFSHIYYERRQNLRLPASQSVSGTGRSVRTFVLAGRNERSRGKHGELGLVHPRHLGWVGQVGQGYVQVLLNITVLFVGTQTAPRQAPYNNKLYTGQARGGFRLFCRQAEDFLLQ